MAGGLADNDHSAGTEGELIILEPRSCADGTRSHSRNTEADGKDHLRRTHAKIATISFCGSPPVTRASCSLTYTSISLRTPNFPSR